MRFKWRVLILFVPVGFLLGLWWGWKLNLNSQSKRPDTDRRLRLLTAERFWSPDLAIQIEKEIGLQLKVTVKGNDLELQQALLAPENYDVAFLFSFELPHLQRKQGFSTIDFRRVENITRLAADFIAVSNQETTPYIPFCWGLNGFARDKSDKDSSDISSTLVLDETSRNEKVRLLPWSYTLLNHTLKKYPLMNKWLASENVEQIYKFSIPYLEPHVGDYKAAINSVMDGQIHWLEIDHGFFEKKLAASEKFQFVVPEDKGLLWTGVGVASPNISESQLKSFEKLMGFMLSKAGAVQLAESMGLATTTDHFDQSDTHKAFSATRLRSFPLSRVQTTEDIPAYGLIWETVINKILINNPTAQHKENSH